MSKIRFALILAWFAISSFGYAGSTFYVHATEGDDSNSGAQSDPFKTIHHAVDQARSGDVVQLVPGQPPIHESISLTNKSGEANAPIVIDGGGNTILGCQPIDEKQWVEGRPGLYRNEVLLRSLGHGNAQANQSLLNRYFFVFGNQINHMGRSSKGSKPPFRAVDQLKPGEWTYVESEGAFYLAIEPGKKLADYQIQAPVLENGLATKGICHHWLIRNLKVERVINDGFNFHGDTQDFRLENVASTQCGDDGMSAHEGCRIEVDGFVSRGNSTGICHIEGSCSENTNTVLTDNLGMNLYLVGSGTHEFKNSTISATNAGILIGAPKGDSVVLKLTDCAVPSPVKGTSPLKVAPGCRVETSGTTKLGEH